MYVHGPEIGYGRLGVELASALRRLGVDVYDHLPDPTGYYENRGYRSGVCRSVCWVSTPTHARGWWKGQVPVIFTMWEAMSLPESFRENLHEFATVVVPSEQNRELFSRYHSNVRVVPLGVDPEVWYYTPRQPPGLFFHFLIGGSGPRKGTDLAHKAFLRVFRTWPRDMPVPKLILKSPRGGDAYYGERVEVVGGRISAADEVALYATAHCYLQPSRGEGFGLQPLQAMAQGIPTILTAAHGHAAFAHLGHGLGSVPAQSGYFIYGDAGDWWEPDFEELCERMEWVYLNYGEALSHAREGSVAVAGEFTWDRTAESFVAAIGRDTLEAEGPAPQTWHEPISRRYLVVTERDWACDIAGISYQFRKGERNYCLADVKRILWEAGLLDPVCLRIANEDDIGLAPHQLERLPEYLERHSWCQTCGQRLNSSPTRAETIFAELNA
jgi:glycosyltransferase involved in cell wall biosynthesis